MTIKWGVKDANGTSYRISYFFFNICGEYEDVTLLTFRIASVCVFKAFKLQA